MMRPATNHAEAALLRAILAENDGQDEDCEKPALIIEDIRSASWASATFIGQTVAIAVRCQGSSDDVAKAMRRMVENLPDREITIAGFIVADLAVSEGATKVLDDSIISKSFTVNALVVCD